MAVIVGEDEARSSAAFEAAAGAEVPRLFQLALSILRDVGEAEDAVQDTLLKGWKGWSRLRETERVSSWLASICVNHCLSRRRGPLARLRSHATLDEAAGSAVGLDPADPDLDRACRRLSPHQRAVITLHYHHGYELDQCARLMRCRPGTARSHLARALAGLRKELTHV